MANRMFKLRKSQMLTEKAPKNKILIDNVLLTFFYPLNMKYSYRRRSYLFGIYFELNKHLRPFTGSHQKNETLNTFLSKQTIISLIYSTKKYGKHNENNSKKMYVTILLKKKIKML